MYEYNQITNFSPFNAYIPKEAREKIAAVPPEMKWIAFGAFQQSAPIGICIASLEPIMGSLDVLHLEVDPVHRNKRIGTTLLAKVQEEAKKQNAKVFSLVYLEGTPETPFVEKILKTNQWKGTRPFLLKAWFDPNKFDHPMLKLPFEYPPGYKTFPWKKLKPSQRKDLLHRDQQNHFLHVFSPFNDEKNIEHLNSLGLEYKGRVVGWMINHKIDPDTIRYTVLYVEPSLKYRGVGIRLLVDAQLIHVEKSKKMGLIEVPYLLVDPSWISFFEKRGRPYAIKVVQYRQGWNTAY